MKKIMLTLAAAALLTSSCSLLPFWNRVAATTRLVAEPQAAAGRSIGTARTLDAGEFGVTPINASGEVITVSIMVGDVSGSALFLITPAQEGFSDSSVTSTSSVLEEFNLADPVSVGREMTIDGFGYPADDEAYATRIELLFAWIDLTFELPAVGFEGPHTIRVAYADVTDLGYRKGDILYLSDAGTYQWFDTQTAALVTDRPANPQTIESLASYSGTFDGMGNQHIPTFAANIAPSAQVHLSKNALTGGSWTFTVYFDLTNGIVLDRDPSLIRNVADLMNAFDIAADVNSSEDNLGFTARLQAVQGP